MLNVLINNMVA